jgi:hypothetical protein
VALRLEKQFAWGTAKVLGAMLVAGAAGAGGGKVATIIEKLMD